MNRTDALIAAINGAKIKPIGVNSGMNYVDFDGNQFKVHYSNHKILPMIDERAEKWEVIPENLDYDFAKPTPCSRCKHRPLA